MTEINNEYPFLCTIVVVDEFDKIWLEESFIVKVISRTESQGLMNLEQQLKIVEDSFVGKGDYVLLLHAHCIFPMAHDVLESELSQEWIFSTFHELNVLFSKK